MKGEEGAELVGALERIANSLEKLANCVIQDEDSHFLDVGVGGWIHTYQKEEEDGQ